MNFFKRVRTPEELVAKCCAAYADLASNAPARQAAIDHVVKYMGEMKVLQFGDGAEKPAKEEEGRVLAVEAAKTALLSHMITQVAPLGFETRKDAAQVFSGLLRRVVDGSQPGVDYLCRNKALLDVLVKGYEQADTALITGPMLRECMKHAPLAKYVLESPALFSLLAYTDVPTFEVASDAFLTFKELLGRHPELTTAFLGAHSEPFFVAFNSQLLESRNYVTRRQSLKLLGELLCAPGNVEAMLRYVNEVAHFMLIMNLLRDASRAIQFEAFHLFKVFVANPGKPAPVAEILRKNADRLLRFLADFQTDRDDEEFQSEKQVLCDVLKTLLKG